ncbi:hypothetical protein ABKA04_007071 [Annulohypoxylon sp. FPYF3050]
MYAELEAWNPFYKINEFVFTAPQSCLVFLAAITPGRRNQIRHITLEYPSHWPVQYDMRFDQNLFALLSKCESLVRSGNGRLEVIIPVGGFYIDKPAVEAYVTGVTELLRDPVRTRSQHLPWELPFFFCTFVLRQDIIDPDIKQLNAKLFIEQNAYLKKAGHDSPQWCPQWFKNMAKNTGLLEAAVAASGIHFPGELRISLDKANGSFGSAATRTRSKCKETPDSQGVVKLTRPRYNEQGILTELRRINDFRWNGTDIQCLAYDNQGSAWEDLYAVLELDNEHLIRQAYDSVMTRYKAEWYYKPGSREKLKNTPHPRHILEIAKATLPLKGARSKRNQSLWKSWSALIKRWDSILGNDTEEGGTPK